MTKVVRSEQMDIEAMLFEGILHDAGIMELRPARDGSRLRMRLRDPGNRTRRGRGELEIEYVLTFERVPHFSMTLVRRTRNADGWPGDTEDVDVLETGVRHESMVFNFATRERPSELVNVDLLPDHSSYQCVRIAAFRRWELVIVFGEAQAEKHWVTR